VLRHHVEPRGGLVEQHQRRTSGERERHAQPAALAAAEPADLPVGKLGQPEALQHLVERGRRG
jgi:hypothetical protein